jgi:esterase/lipase superfamily enzyme
MQAQDWTWTTARLPVAARLKRWGHFGTPLLLFPTAGGELEELERCGAIAALEPMIDSGRVKVYSVDGLSIRSWLRGDLSLEETVRFQSGYDAFLFEEIVPRIRQDCLSAAIEVALAGASLGALTAVATFCRHPEVFRGALGLDGVYDLARLVRAPPGRELDFASPITFLPTLLDGGPTPVSRLRQRWVMLGTGEGGFETPEESRRLAAVLERCGVPHALELLGLERDHDWRTWREMLPRYVERLI